MARRMTAPTLPDFLLARVAEDEVVAQTRRDDAECEAKRRIVEEHEMMPARKITVGVLRLNDGRELSPYYVDGCCARCTSWGEWGGPADKVTGAPDYCATLRALALPYADHPDYRAEWKP